jgi:predicted RNA binding protein YcfA (HicA-like mRNA interferase family)
MKFPRDAPVQRVVRTLTALGFRVVRVGNHIAMERANADGSRRPLTMPSHEAIRCSTPRAICT